MPRGKKKSSTKKTVTKKTTKKKAPVNKTATKKTTKKKAPAKKTATKKTVSKKTTKKKAGRPKGSKNKKKIVEKPQILSEEIPEEELVEEVAPKKSTLIHSQPTQWILASGMHFGIINEGFTVGTMFTVDWDNRHMRCEANGVIYENIKDLEIGIRLGTVIPYGEEDSDKSLIERQEIEARAHQAKLQKIEKSRKQRDDNIRNMIDSSDRDVVRDIDISHTNSEKKINSVPTRTTASSEVSVLKPQQQNSMEVHYSDTPQDGQIIRSSNEAPVRPRVANSSSNAKPLSPVLAGTKVWDATKSGSVENDIRKKMSDYSIKIDETGQQYIRGLPVIRDDSEASGQSRNEGMVVSMTKEQLADRSHKIQNIRANKKQEVAQNRSKSGQSVQDESVVGNQLIESRGPEMDVSNMVPQDLVAGMGVSDTGLEKVESTPIPITDVNKTAKKRKKSSLAGKLLRRRK